MARYKPWTEKSYLYSRYVEKGMTIEQIADECKKAGNPVTSMTIYNNLKKHGLLKNSRNLGRRSYKTGNGKGYYG